MNTKAKVIALLLALVMTVGLFAGCGQAKQETPAPAAEAPKATEAPKAAEAPKATEAPKPTEAPAPEPTTHIVIDALGREVEVPNNPQRIALGATVMPHIIYAMQGHLKNVAALNPGSYKGWEESPTLHVLAPELEGVDTSMLNEDFTMNVEALAAAGIDLVFNWDSQIDQAEQLEKLGIPCVLLTSAKNLQTLEDLMKIVAETLNCQDRCDEALAYYDATEDYFASRKADVEALTEKPRVVHFQRTQKLTVYGKGNNPYIINLVGGTAYELPAEVTTPTMEDIIAFDPEIIFISHFDDTTPEDLYENRIEGQDWSGVSAVINHRVYKTPNGLYRWSPPNTFEKPFYMKWAATVIQPELFSDIDVRKELKDFYQSFFNVTLSEKQLDTIFCVEVNKDSK